MKKLVSMLCSLTMLLMLTACAPDRTTPSGEESAAPSVSVTPAPTSSPEQEQSSQTAPLATGDYSAFLRFLRSARSAQVFSLDADRMSYTALGRIADPAAFSGLYDVFAAASSAPLASFDFGAAGILRLSEITSSDGTTGELWLAPVNGGANMLFEIGGTLPNQRFSFKADMTSLAFQLLSPYLAVSSDALLDDLSAALEQADADALCALTGWDDPDTFAPLAGMTLHCGGYLPYEEDDDSAVYTRLWLLTVTIEDGGGIWPEGTGEWIVELGPVGSDGGLGVARVLPRANWEFDSACRETDPAALIDTLNLVLGPVAFGRVDTLDPALLCEAILVRTKAVYHAEDDEYDFAGSEVRDVAARFFGIAEYTGDGLACYDPAADQFALYGRGGAEAYTLLIASDEENSALTITQKVFSDRACLIPLRTLTYTFQQTSSGEYAIVSCD